MEDEENEDEGAQLSDTVPDLIKDEDMPKILYGIKAVREVEWPADPERVVYVRALSREEIFEGISEGKGYIEDLGLSGQIFERITRADGSKQDITCLDMAMRDEWVCAAYFKDKACKVPVFDTTKVMRRTMTNEEINRLYAQLAEHMQQVTPMTHAERMGRDELFTELVETLKKKPGEISLANLPRDILEMLVRFMVVKSYA